MSRKKHWTIYIDWHEDSKTADIESVEHVDGLSFLVTHAEGLPWSKVPLALVDWYSEASGSENRPSSS